MKKLYLATIIMLGAVAFSCTKSQEQLPAEMLGAAGSRGELVDDGSKVYDPTATIEDFVLDGAVATKTVITINQNTGANFTFADGDRLGVYPYYPKQGSQAQFQVSSSSAETFTFNGNGFALESGQLYAAYYPLQRAGYGDEDQGITSASMMTHLPVDYTRQVQTSTDGTSFTISTADYLVANGITPLNGVCNFKMSHIGALLVMDVTVPVAGTYTELALNSSSAAFLQTGTVDLTQTITLGEGAPTQGIAITPVTTGSKAALTLGEEGSGLYIEAGQTVRFCMMVAPVDLRSSAVTLTLRNSTGDNYMTQVESKNFKQGYAYMINCGVGMPTNLSTTNGLDSGTTSTANCYIVNTNAVNPAGYKFVTTVAGNGHGVDWSSIGFADNENEAYPTGGGAALAGNGVEIILNQNNCVSDVYFYDNKIYFKATGSEGNAKLTLTNNGTRVWTWHIWCTDQPGTVTIPSKVTSNTSYAVMDRNIGAITAGREGESQAEEMYGFYYPFGHYIGFTAAEYSNGDEGAWRMIDTYAYHPEKPYLKFGSNYQTFRTYGWANNENAPYALIWGAGSYYQNNYVAGTSSVKTMYDPCPPGYKVMSYDVLDGYSGTNVAEVSADYYGVSISGTNGTLFIPYNGRIYRGGYSMNYVNIWGTDYPVSTFYFAYLWTSRFWQNLTPSCYTIAKKPGYNDQAQSGAVTVDILSRGMGVRCMAQ